MFSNDDKPSDGVFIFGKNKSIIVYDAGSKYHEEELIIKKERQKRKKNVRVNFNIFKEILNYINEEGEEKIKNYEFWKNKISEFSNSVLPKNITYDGKNLTHNSKNNKKKTHLPFDSETKDIVDAFERLKNFLKPLDIVPNEERLNMDTEIEELYKSGNVDTKNNINTFKDLKRNQESALLLFQENMLKKYEIKDKKTENNFISIMNSGFSSKLFNDENIIVEKGIIKKIDLLEFDEKKRIFYINVNKINEKESKKKKVLKRKIPDKSPQDLTYTSYTNTSDNSYFDNSENGKDIKTIVDEYFIKIIEKVHKK
jgi:hypothetical protein